MPIGGNNRSPEKAQNFGKTFKRMIKEFKAEYVLFIIVIILTALSSVFTILGPVVLQRFLTAVENVGGEGGLFTLVGNTLKMNWDTFFIYFGVLASIYIVSAFLIWISEFLTVSIANRYAFKMRSDIKSKLDRLPLSYFDKVPYGDTLSIGTNDVDNIARNLQSIVVQTCQGLTLFLGTLIAMLVTKWQLALVALCSLPLTLLIVWLVSRNSQKQFVNYRYELGEINGKIEENYAGYLVIKLFNKQKDIEEDFGVTNNKLSTADRNSQFLSGLIFPTTNFINNLAYVGIAVVGGIIQDTASMVSFFIFLNLFNRPFQQIGQIINVIQSVVASGERIYSLLDEEEFSKDPVAAFHDEEKIQGSFVFDNVSFAYSPDKPLIDNFNLKVNQGDTIAIVGPTGAGKTTIVNLIMRFYEINDGHIYLDGIDTKNYKRATLRRSIGMVLQDTWLFRGTIKENLLYGDENATMQDIENACKEAHIDHFINTLPGKYDFVLNEDGTNISQGQRQLLTIARAIISKPKIMILDEATSSVDTRTEQLIQDALNHIMKNRTSFIIAHRLSTIKNAKLIIVMKKGHIVETGNHEELLAKKGFYYELYNSQFAGNNPMAKTDEKEDS